MTRPNWPGLIPAACRERSSAKTSALPLDVRSEPVAGSPSEPRWAQPAAASSLAQGQEVSILSDDVALKYVCAVAKDPG